MNTKMIRTTIGLRTLASGCGTPPVKKKSVLELFRSLGVGNNKSTEVAKDPHARALLGLDEQEAPHGHSHGEHATALEKDLLLKQAQMKENDHGHSHAEGDHGHSHAHGDSHGHSHDDNSHNKTISIEETDDDFVEMWNPKAPAGPEHGGPRGLEPTRYGQEWEKKGRVSDFS